MCQDICESYTKLVFKLVVIPRANHKNIARIISQVIQRMGQDFPRSQQVISSRTYLLFFQQIEQIYFFYIEFSVP